MNKPTLRYSIRTLLVFTAMVAATCALLALFVQTNYNAWNSEQSALIDGAVRWNDDTYIPNLDIGYTCTVPEWLIAWLPAQRQEIFFRVTSLDFRAGRANAADLSRCVPLQHVNTVYLGQIDETESLVRELKKFPQLKHVFWEGDPSPHEAASAPSLPAIIERELPGIKIQPYHPNAAGNGQAPLGT